MILEVQRSLTFPQEAAARGAVRQLVEADCPSVTIREPGDSRRYWQVVLPVIHPVPSDDPEPLSPFIWQEKRRLTTLARSWGGMLLTHMSRVLDDVPASASYDPATATVALPDPLPLGLPQPCRAPA